MGEARYFSAEAGGGGVDWVLKFENSAWNIIIEHACCFYSL